MGHAIEPGRQDRGGEESFREVLQCVGPLHFEGSERAGENHGYLWFGNLLEKQLARLAQGIGAMEDDDAGLLRVFWILCPGQTYGIDDSSSVLIGQIQGVLVHELVYRDFTILQSELAEHSPHDTAPIAQVALDLIVDFLDGSASGYQGDRSHRRSLSPRREDARSRDSGVGWNMQ